MSKFDEMLEELQAEERVQEGCWDDDLYETGLWNKYFEGQYTEIVTGLNKDQHRWYELTTTVLQFEDRFLGIHSVTNTYSEGMSYGDCGVKYEFFEMEEVSTVTYEELKR